MELAIETALHACSVALIDGDGVVAERHEVIARGHAERLVPLVAEVLAEAGGARPDSIIVDVGPGSFTGIRVGIAAAKAFAIAWQAPVSGCTSTALVAAGVFAARPDLDLLYVAFDASRGEVYAQSFDRAGATGELGALTPEAAAAQARGLTVAGSGAALLIAADPALAVAEHPWPRAADARFLAAAARARDASPLYVRAPDARVPA